MEPKQKGPTYNSLFRTYGKLATTATTAVAPFLFSGASAFGKGKRNDHNPAVLRTAVVY